MVASGLTHSKSRLQLVLLCLTKGKSSPTVKLPVPTQLSWKCLPFVQKGEKALVPRPHLLPAGEESGSSRCKYNIAQERGRFEYLQVTRCSERLGGDSVCFKELNKIEISWAGDVAEMITVFAYHA